MLYENYYKKVSIIARILNQIRRFRVLILAIIAAIVAAFCAFVIFQGTVYDKVSCPTEVIYGDELSYEAKALFRDVEYEFSNDSEFKEIFESSPKMPGEYCVRAVSSSFFGSSKYGKAHTFRIVPRKIDVNVKQTSIIYGDIPTAQAQLVYNDKILCDEYSYEDISAKQTTVSPMSDAVRVFNENNEDVTYAYIINPIQSNIEFTPRDITVTISSASSVYNALPFSFDNYSVTLGAVAAWGEKRKDEVIATFDASLIDVGVTQNVPTTLRVLHPDGKEVTAHYNISVIQGKLEVTKRPIKINLKTDKSVIEYTYDAEAHSFTYYEIDSSTPLVEGHTDKLGSYSRITDVGETKNLLSLNFFDENGKDVSENHYCVFAPENVMLKVNKRPVTLQAGDDIKVYDGTPLSNDSEWEVLAGSAGKSEGLVAKHKVDSLEIRGLRISVGTTSNEIVQDSVKIIEKAGRKNVTSNYEINCLPGELVIEPRPITITTSTDEALIYNGEEQFKAEFSVENGIDIHEIKVIEKTITKVKDVKDTETSVKNVFAVEIYDGSEEDVTKNYDITYEFGRLKVLPRPITVKTEDKERVYDASVPQSADFVIVTDNEGEIDKQGLLDKHKVASWQVNRNIIGSDVGEYRVKILDGTLKIVEIGNESNDVTSNYDIAMSDGKLTVNRRQININTIGQKWTYDGEAHSWLEWKYNSNTPYEIVSGQEANIVGYSEITDFVEGGMDNEIALQIKQGQTDVTNNYDIVTAEYGKLIIDKREIEIKTYGGEWVYDGKAHFNEEWDYYDNNPEYKILDDQTAEVVNHSEIINVIDTGMNNQLTLQIKQGERDVTFNYIVTTKEYGKLLLKHREIIIKTPGDEWVYDGKAHFNEDWEYYEANPTYTVAEGQIAEVFERSEIINVVDSGMDNKLTLKIKQGESDVTPNYIVTTKEYGKLAVKHREIIIKTPSDEWVYDGETHFNKGWTYYDVNPTYTVAEGQIAEVVEYSKITNVADSGMDNELTLKIKQGEQDVTPNYIIKTQEYGKLVITKRSINILTNSNRWTYDGQEHSDMGWTYVEGSLHIVDGQSYKIDESKDITTIIDVGEKDNKFEIVIMSGNADVTANYDITYRYGKLEITPRKITIQTNYHLWKHDGTARSDTGWTYVEGSLHIVGGQSFEVDGNKAIATITDVGATSNVFEIIIMSNGTDVTSNYDIEYRYGKLFVVSELSITTEGAEKVYDSTPLVNDTYSTSELPEGCQFEDIVVIGSQKNAGESDNTVDKSKIWISYNDGENVHVVLFDKEDIEYIFGKLIVTQRCISITTNSNEWTYDGKQHLDTGWEYTADLPSPPYYEIVEGQTAKTDVNNPITTITDVKRDENGNVIGINNIFSIRIYDGSEDVTDNYDIEYVWGKLKVNPRPVTIQTNYHLWKNDGQPHSDGGHTVVDKNLLDYGLVDGHTTSAIPGTLTYITNVGQKDNIFEILILNGVVDVTSNYDIEYLYGKLFVSDEFKISTEGAEKVYDGTPLTNKNYSTYGLPNGCEFEDIEVTGSQKNVGESDNTVDKSKIWVSYGNHVVLCDIQTVTYDYGKLVVTKRSVKIHTNSNEWTYDGQEHSQPDWDYTQDSPYKVVDFHRTQLDKITTVKNVKDTLTRKENKFELIIYDGTENVTENYDIEYVYGTLKINPRPITVTTEYKERVYDGEKPQSKEFVIITDREGDYQEQKGLLNNHIVQSWEINGDILSADVGDYVVEIIEGTLKIVEIGNSAVDLTDNYEITYENGALKITPRPITIQTESHLWKYDGQAHSEDKYTVVDKVQNDYGLIDGHITNVIQNTIPTITNVGQKDNNFKISIKVGGIDVTSNYDIEYLLGKLFVVGQFKITTSGAEKVYDGTPLTNSNYTPSALPDGCRFEDVEVTGSQTDAGESDNTVDKSKVWVSYEGKSLLCDLGTIEYEYGKLVVTKRPITIRTNSNSWEYDGEAHSEKGYEIILGELVAGHWLDVVRSTEIIDMGEKLNEFLEAYIYSAGGDNVTENYDISYENGTLKIVGEFIKIKIKLSKVSKEYDGTPLVFGNNCYSIVSIPEGLSFSFLDTVTVGITEVGVLTIEDIKNASLHYQVFDGEEDISDRCIIEFEEPQTPEDAGYLSVTQREITLKAADATKEYDGAPLVCDVVLIVEGSIAPRDTLHAHAVGENMDQPIVVNRVDEKTVKITYIDEETGDEIDITECYHITYENGELRVY